MKKVKDWLKRNKDELLFSWGLLATMLLVGAIMVSILFMGISEDLVSRVEKEVTEKQMAQEALEDKTKEAAYYYIMYDNLIQSYEDVIPKQQYIDDIEYLESVIRQLREACGKDCEGM